MDLGKLASKTEMKSLLENVYRREQRKEETGEVTNTRRSRYKMQKGVRRRRVAYGGINITNNETNKIREQQGSSTLSTFLTNSRQN